MITEDWFFCSHFLERGRAALDAGFDVAIATRKSTKATLLESLGMQLFPVEFSRRGTNPMVELLTAWRLRRIVLDYRPDVIHNVALKPVVTGSLGELLAGKRCIINAPVGMGYLFTEVRGRTGFLKVLVQLMLKFLLNPAGSRVIIENEDDYRDLLAAGLARSDSTYLIRGAGVDTKANFPRPEPSGPVTILMASRLLRDKGVREFVEAARLVRATHPEARFLLAGGLDGGNPSSFNNSDIKSWTASGNVECLGHRDDVGALLSNCHIACLPSYREGLPKSLLEAAAAGRPIVATDVPGCRSVVAHGINGLLVPARDADSLAAAICTLIQSPELRAKMGHAGRIRAEKEFAEEIIVEQTLRLYREVSNA